eukprot:1845152-Pleurochrysis_carterae.AAC.1
MERNGSRYASLTARSALLRRGMQHSASQVSTVCYHFTPMHLSGRYTLASMRGLSTGSAKHVGLTAERHRYRKR